MRRLGKFLVRIAVVVALGFVAYAIFGDLPPPVRERVVPVTVPAPGGGGPAEGAPATSE